VEFISLAEHAQELQRLLVDAGLARPAEKPRIQPLAGGVSSAIFRVDLASGTCCVKQALPQLKVAKEWRVPVDRALAEVAWLRTAAAIVPGHVPRVLAQDARTRSFAMEYLAEGSWRNWKAELLAGRVDPAAGAAVGAVLGRIHAATARDPALPARFANDANFHALRLEPYLVESGRVHPALAATLAALVERTQKERRVLVHGDVSPKNILLGPAGPVLLDAECACFGDPAFDLAFCLNHLLLKAAWLPRLLPPLLATHDALVAAYAAHVDFEPWPALQARVASLLPALTLARIDGKSPAEYLDAPARTRIRAAAIALVQAPPARLAALAARWAREFAA
jgi:aminoglycoside phosphotransferase (APT) family kinase protein